MQLTFGLSSAVPGEVTTAWGARLIAPDELLGDRQATCGENVDALLDWLNGGALKAVLARLRAQPLPNTRDVVTLDDDATGKIVGSALRSFGYVYLAAWMHRQ